MYSRLPALAIHPLLGTKQPSLLIPYNFFQKHLSLPALETSEHKCGSHRHWKRPLAVKTLVKRL